MFQALWLLDQSNLGRTTGGLSAFDLPLFVDRGSDVLGASVDPGALPRAAFDTAQSLASVNHFTDGCPFKWHK